MVAMATIYKVNFMWKTRKSVSPFPISTIMITENLNWYACASPLFKNTIIPNIRLLWLPWQPFLLCWHCTTLKYYINYKEILNGSVFYILLLIIVVRITSKIV